MFNDLYNYVPDKWKSYIHIPSLNRVIEFLNKHQLKDVLPSKDRIFEALNYINPENVHVLILGPPSPQKELSSGIAYSIPIEYRFTDISKRIPEPPLQKTVIDYIYSIIDRERDITLKEAVKSGILLMNYPLTCTIKRKYAHIKCGWEDIIKRLIERLLYRDDSRLLLVAWNEEAYKIFTEIITDWFPDKDGTVYTSPSYKGVRSLVASGPDKNITVTDKRSKYNILSIRLNFDNEIHKHIIRNELISRF